MNEAAYGQSEPPAYNISTIKSLPGRMSLWYTKNDPMVPLKAIDLIIEDLKCKRIY